MATNTTAQRAGIPAACLAHITEAETHVKRLFFTKDGGLTPPVQADQSLPLRCLNGAFGHQGELWKAAWTGDAEETLRLARLWYKAVRAAWERLTAPAKAPEDSSTAQEG